MHDDWHLERVVSAISSAAQVPGEPAVANALAAAIAKRRGESGWRPASVNGRRRMPHVGEEDAVISGLETELRELRANDSGMSVLTAVEYITSDPGHRIALYRRCSGEDDSIGAAKDLALLERRANAEGFQV